MEVRSLLAGCNTRRPQIGGRNTGAVRAGVHPLRVVDPDVEVSRKVVVHGVRLAGTRVLVVQASNAADASIRVVLAPLRRERVTAFLLGVRTLDRAPQE